MLKEKKEKRVTIRLTEDEEKYLKALAYMSGMTVAQYLRTIVDASVNALKINIKQGKIKLEDFEAILND